MCPSPSYSLLSVLPLSIPAGHLHPILKNFPSLHLLYFLLTHLPSLLQEPASKFALTLSYYLGFFLNWSLGILPSLLKVLFLRPHSSYLSWVLGSSFFPPRHIFFPWLLLPAQLMTHQELMLALGLIFVSTLNAPFVPALQEFHVAVSLNALIFLTPI